MREIRTSGSMSGDGRRAGVSSANAPILDSTEARHHRTRMNAQIGSVCRAFAGSKSPALLARPSFSGAACFSSLMGKRQA